MKKPGPPRFCECGTCDLCRRRARHVVYYNAHRKELIAKNTEQQRVRRGTVQPKDRPQRPPPGLSDEDLDRAAEQWLNFRFRN